MRRRVGQFGATLLIGVLVLAVLNIFMTPNRVWAQGPGSLETTFNTAVGTAFGPVLDMERDSAGNIYVAYDQVIKKIDTAGSTTLTITTPEVVYGIALDSAGNILMQTYFKSIYRYKSDGTLDTTFNTNSKAGTATSYFNNSVLSGLAVQTANNDRIIATSAGANSTNRLVGIQGLPTTAANAGKIDTNFTQTSITSTMGTPSGLYLDSANNIYVLGPSSMGYVKRLSPNGTFSAADNTFNSAITSNLSATPKEIVVDGSGNVYVVGDFTGRVKKFSSAGVPDSAYNTNTAAAALPTGSLTTTLQSDGKLIVGGSFSGNLKRFNTNGTIDSTFVYNNTTGGAVYKAVMASDGNIVVGTQWSPYIKKVYSVFLAPNSPGTPTAVAGDAQATVTVVAPTSGVAADKYTVTAVQDNSKTCTVTGTSGSCTITGLTNGTSYTFTSIAHNGDQTSPSSAASSSVTPVGVPPVFSSAAVNSTGTVLTLTYNEALNSTTAPTSQFTVIVGGQPATITSATVSGSTVQLALDAVVIQGSTVTVAYQAPADSGLTSNEAIQDLWGTDAVSLSTRSVTNGSLVDRTAPTYVSVANTSTGTTITLTYNENLSTTTALASAFTVTNGGVTIPVSSVATTSGTKTVVLTLTTPVGQGKTVTVAYAAPTPDGTSANNATQDVAGNDAPSFSAITLSTNSSSVDQTAPAFSWGSLAADGRTLSLNYSEIIRDPRAPASAFTVLVDGSPVTVSSVAANGNAWTAILTLESPVGSGKAVTVAYTAPAVDSAPTNAAIQDNTGNDAASFSATSVTNSSQVDQTAPVYSTSSLASDGLSLTITYNENLHKTSLPLASSFSVLSNGSPVSVSSVAIGPNNATGNKSIVLTLASAIGTGKTVTVAYDAPAINNATTNSSIQDLVGNDALSLTATAVSNNSSVDQTAPTFSSATLAANGLTLTMTYNETLRDPRALPGAFTVLVNGSPVAVSSVAANGATSTVVLTLSSPVGSGKAVTIAYDAPTVDAGISNSAIQDTAGNDAVSLTARTVTNSSTVDQIAPVFGSATLAADGRTLTLSYNEVLRDPRAPASAFTVLADGSPVTVSSVAANGNISTVVLTLATAVSNEKIITVSYDAPTVDNGNTNSAIQDTAGNDAVSLTARAVTNNSAVDVTRPTIASATVLSSGTQVDIAFSETISCTISADSAFTIEVNGSPVSINGFNRSCPSNKITASLSGVTITSNQTVTVSYTAPADDSSPSNAALQDVTGNDMLSVTGVSATNNSLVPPDLRAPVFTSATVNSAGTLLTLSYDEAMISRTAPASAYTVTIDGVDFQPSAAVVSGSTVQLTMGTAVQFGKTVTVSYTAPTTDATAANSAVQDASGNDSISLVNAAVSNFSTAGPDVTRPTLSNVSYSGSTVTLTFNETLGSIGAPGDTFTVFVGNDAVTVTNSSISGSTVVLTLASAVPSGELVSVTYTAPTSNSQTSNAAIQDYAGNDAASFSGNNRTTSTAWSWVAGSPSNNTSCTGSRYANSGRQRSLPNGVTYSIAVSGPYVCMFEASESLSDRGGTESNFTKTGLVTDPGVFMASLEPETTSGDTNCTLYTMGATLSKCMNRGFVTMTFSEPTLNPVISFAGWGGADGGAKSWSELQLVTPNVTLSMLSGTNLQVVGGTYVGVVDPSPGTRCTNSIPAGCGSLQVNGTVTEVKFALNYNSNGTGWGNEDQWNMVASVVEDFGQLPERYDAPAASHVVGHLKLGSVVTADNLNVLYGTTNADAVTYGSAIPLNEDGVASVPAIGDGDIGTTYSLPVSLSGVERSARLCGWIDFNRDGTLALAERSCATNPAAGATSATLNWTVPSNIVAGRTYARIRLSYDAVPIPTGKVSSGEVEDYSFTIASNAIPNAVNDTSTNAQDINQIISPLTNDNFEAGSPAVNSSLLLCGYGAGPFVCDKTSLLVLNEGTYTVNSDGTVTFDPLPNYVGTATPVKYQISDTQSRARTATITPTVTPSPTATSETSRDYVNITQSKNVLTNDTPGVGVFSVSSVKLCSSGQTPTSCSATTVAVTGGVYTLNTSTGVITFVPATDWVGTAPPVTYQVADGSGQIASATYTPTVVSRPTATNDTSLANYDVTQTIRPLLNDAPGGSPLAPSTLKLCGIDDPATSGTNESESPNNCTKTSLTIPGEGTYTVNSDGTVTFDPLPTFFGTASSRPYQISDELGETTSAAITPTVGTPPLPAAQPNTSSGNYDTNQTLSPLDGDTAGSSSFPLHVSTIRLCGLADNTVTPPIAAETPNSCSQTSVMVPGEGTYTLNTTTGVVTFDPLPSFTGQVQTPVTYQVKDSLDRFVNSTLTPTVGPPPVPTATADALTRAYDTNQTYTPLSNDSAGAADFPLDATSVKLCGLDDPATAGTNEAESPNNCTKTSLTVPGEGTYTVNNDGTVTFDPLPTFTGQVQTPVRYQAKDSLNRYVNTTITPTVGLPPAPSATADAITDAYDTNQTYTPLGNDAGGAADFPLEATSVKLCGIDPAQTPNSCDKTSLTVPGEGTYTVNNDGTVTFNPLPTFTGTVQTPARYQAKDSLNRYVNTTITPTVGLPPAPSATADAITDAYDTNQTYTPLGNDTRGATDFPLLATSVKLCGLDDPATSGTNEAESPNTCSKTSVTVPGEGTYTVNNDGTVTFDPLPTFTGQVQTPVRYQANDALVRYVNTTITPTVGLPPTPSATADAITDAYDTNQTYTPLGNDTRGATDFPLLATSVKLCGLGDASATPPVVAEAPNTCSKTSVTVPGEGTYTLNTTTGVVTFDPLPTFTGTVATSVKYQAQDSLGRYLNSTITPTVGEPPIPTAVADAITDAYDTNQTYTPLGNDTAGAADFPLIASSVKLCGINPVETPNSCTQTSLTVPGEGTYTVNNDGTVTFNPLPTFTGTVLTSVTYQAKDSLNRYVDETITPTVGLPPVPTASADAIRDAHDTNQTYTPLANDTRGATDFPLLASSVKLCGIDDPATSGTDEAESPNNCSKTSVTIPGEGTYTVNPDGTVTFNPLPTFTGTVATPMKYQAQDSLNRFVNSTITPRVDPPTAPVATPETQSVLPGATATYTTVIGANGLGTGTGLQSGATNGPCLVNPATTLCGTSVNIPGEGTWTIDQTTGVVTFAASQSIASGTRTSVTYRITDVAGQTTTSTLTPVVPPAPDVKNDTSTDAYDTNQVIDILDNDDPGHVSAPLVASSVKLCGLDDLATAGTNEAESAPNCTKTSVTVPGEGTYTVNPDGTVTFNPLPSFTGTVTRPVTYQVADTLGQIDSATITPTVTPPAINVVNDTSSGLYDINQVIPVLTNDTPGAEWVLSSVKLCGLDDLATAGTNEAESAPNCTKTSVTVPGEGTYTVNPDGTVTFNPLPSFTGTVTRPITYQVTDILGRTEDATITPTVGPPPVPTATADALTRAYDTNQTYSPLANDTPGVADFPLSAASVKLCGINPVQTPNNCTQTSLTVPGEGTYTVNGDGTVTFDPLPTFTGTVATPVKYQAKDSLDRFVNTTITPTVGPPPVPTAAADAISDAYDTNQTYTPLANDTPGASDFPFLAASVKLCGIDPAQTPNNCTQTSLTVPGEGTYTVNPDGTVTFNPLPTFTGQVQTPVKYQAKDSLDRYVNTTITPTVGLPPVPTATADAITTAYDTNQTYTPLSNDTRGAADFPLSATSVKLCGINPAEIPNNCTQTSLTVPGEGTYTVNPDGTVTFDPSNTFSGTVATPVKYQAKDSLDRFVNTTITPTITPPPINVVNDTSSGLYDVNQVIPVLTNDTPGAQWVLSSVKLCGINPVQTPNNCTQTSLTVPGEGTYTVNPDGTVTFNPLPMFTGQVQTPVTYQVTDILGRTEDATITPTVGPPPVPTASPDALTRAYDTNQTYTPLANDTPGVADFPLSAASVKLCGISPAETPNNCTQTSLTVPGEGTYTVNGDGTVTFDPLPTFTGTVATPVKYQAKDSLDRFVNTTITPTVLPPPVPAASPDAITTAYDTNQTYTPLANDTAGASDFPLSAASVKLCGVSPVQTPNSCDKTSLTVPGEGTYTVNNDGTVSFDPLPTFTGTVATPVKYQAKDSLDRFVNTTITPTIGLPPVPTASPDAITTAYDTNQTYTPLANDTRGATDFPLLASSVKLCGIDPAQTPNSCDKTSLTVPGEGTYTVNNDGTVSFDPLPTFTGTVATPVKYQAKDSLNRFVDTTITPTIGLPPVPTASPDALTRAYDTNQTYTPLANDTAGATSFPLLATSVKLCGLADASANPPVTAETPNNCTKTSLTVPGEGTYTVNPDGTVSFDPLPTFTGTVATPVKYQAKDSLNRFVDTTITPTVLPPPVPTASPDAITTAYDTNQTYTPLANDTAGAADFPLSAASVKLCGVSPVQTPNSCDKTSLTVPGEGTYTVNNDGTVSFDPLPTFVGTVSTPVKYQAKDSLDRFVNTTITPTILPPPVPTASPDAITTAYDTNQTYTPLANDTPGAADFPLLASSVKLCGLSPAESPNNCTKTSLTVAGEGTYTVNNDGTVSFDPLPTFVGTVATPVKYQAKDSLDRFVNTTITPTILPPPVPTASPDAITTAYDTNQTYTPLANDTRGATDFPLLASSVKLCGVSPVQTPNSCDKTSLTVAGEGTYTVNNDGTVSFDPLPTFTGTVATPVTYQAKDSLDRFVNTTITPTILTAPITVVDDTKTGPYDSNQTIDVLRNDQPSAQWVPTSVKLCGINPVEAPNNCTKTSLTVPGEGTYTVNADGTVTFDPLPTFVGTVATPVTYQVTDVLGRTADADITPTVLPPPPPVATPQTQVVVPSGTATYTNVIGTSALATGTQLQSGATNGPCLVDPSTSNCGTTVVIAGQGTWSIDRTTGIATFVADAGITPGTKTSVTYKVTDIIGQTATSTLTPIVPPPPSATDDYSSGPFDTNQTLTPFSNDSFDSLAPARTASLRLCGAIETPNGCTQTSVVVPNEGTFTINSGGTVTFDPLPTFIGTATPLPYQAEDIFGRFVDAALHPSVAAPDAPVATPQTKIVAPGTQVAFTNVIGSAALATGAQLQSGSTNGPCLVDPVTNLCGTTVVVPGEGTWTIDQTTGVAVFAAEPGITPGTKTSVIYRVTDVIGQTASSTLTPIVPPPPSASNDAQTSPLDENQMYAPLNNDSFSSLSPASLPTLRLCSAGQTPTACDKTTVTVAEEGTYTVNENGTVLFDPLPDFVGTATPMPYQVADILGRIVNATITPTILPPPVPEASQDTGRAKEGNKVVLEPWMNDSAGVVAAGQMGTPSLVPTSVRLCPMSTVVKTRLWVTGRADPSCTLMKVTTADGTYTVDPKTGKVTFVHRKGFTGTVTQPVPYQIATNWKVPTGSMTARSMLIPTIVSKRVPMVTIGNKVWRDVKGDGYQNRKDRGIPGVRVTISTTSGGVVTDIFGNVVQSVLTNKKGLYKFTDLPAGQYKVTVAYPPGLRPTIANRPGRKRNSSTGSAISSNLRLGQTDDSLDFGMVAFDNTLLPQTS
jgi:uncharacterized repeat protein (TIGR02059 family)